MEANINWEQAAADYEFKRKLSEFARDILVKAEGEEQTFENLQKVAKDLVRQNTLVRSFCSVLNNSGQIQRCFTYILLPPSPS